MNFFRLLLLFVSALGLFVRDAWPQSGGARTFTDANWQVVNPAYPGTNGNVSAMVADARGHLYVSCGRVLGDKVMNGVARWDGTTWSALGAGVEGTVEALAVDGTTLYAGGRLVRAGGVAVKQIARWNGVEWSALGSGSGLGGDSSGTAYVTSLAVVGGHLYMGGRFPFVDGVRVNSIARWDGAAWSPVGSGIDGDLNNYIHAMAVIGGDLYVAGTFTSVSGVPANRIARWDGAAWSAVGSGLESSPGTYVKALAVSGGELYAAGKFSVVGGQVAANLAKWNGTTWGAVPLAVPGEEFTAVAASGSDVYAAGRALGPRGYTTRLGRWNGAAATVVNTELPGSVDALSVSGGALYVGGSGILFPTEAGPFVRNLARWNPGGWQAAGATGMDGSVTSLAIRGNELYAGGFFVTTADAAATRVARWDGTRWSALGSGLTAAPTRLVAGAAGVFASGDFFPPTGGASNLSRWDGSAWSELAPDMHGGIGDLAVVGNDLYAGGSFTRIAGVPANRIAKWSGGTWLPLGSGVEGGGITAMAVIGSDLYTGGSFTTAGGLAANRIARWDGTAWSRLGAGLPGNVTALAAGDGELYAATRSSDSSNISTLQVSRWNGSAWSTLGSWPTARPDYVIRTLVANRGGLFAGGTFSIDGGTTESRLLRWNGAVWTEVASGVGDISNTVNVLATGASDRLFLGGSFMTAGDKLSPYLAALNVPAALVPSIHGLSAQAAAVNVARSVNFSLGDIDAAVAVVAVSSDNPTLLPPGGIVLAGTGGQRSLTLTPAPDATGLAIVTVRVTSGSGVSATSSFTFSVSQVNASSRLVNISTRGETSLIAGFVIQGTQPQPVLIRAVGPGLRSFGVTTAIADPILELFSGGTRLASNHRWPTASNAGAIASAAARVGAFPLTDPPIIGDSAILMTLAPGSYSAQMREGDYGGGQGLVEIYDASEAPGPAKLINVATRGWVRAGAGGALIAGFILTGDRPTQVLIRAAGPALAAFGVSDRLPDPRLQLFSATGPREENDNWGTQLEADATAAQIAATAVRVGAFAFPTGSRDAALAVSLPPGAYTAQVTGAGPADAGAALIEVYEVP